MSIISKVLEEQFLGRCNIFGRNEIIGKKYFDNAPENSLYVTSIFYTIQGEGPFRGLPAVFVRLAKCNLACSFCDTYFDGGDWMTYDQILERARDRVSDFFTGRNIIKSNIGFEGIILVVTGGEPSLQKNLYEFLSIAESYFDATQIESNGILVPPVPETTVVVISPKCIEKNGVAIKYFKPLKESLERADVLKFVIDSDPKSLYHTIPEWAFDWANNHFGGRNDIYISPINVYAQEPQKSKQLRSQKNDITLEERSAVDEVISFWEPGLLDMKRNQQNHEYAATYCLEHGLNLNLQMHLYASVA